MQRRLLVGVSLLVLVLTLPLVAFGDVTVGGGGGTPGTSLNFQLVGANPLFARGMNAALTLYDHYAYVGNRSDGSSTCGFGDPRGYLTQNCPHPHPGIPITDIADPANPTVVGELGLPYAGKVGITTRELRVWPQKKLLMVMTFRCSSAIHACPPGNDTIFPFDIKFFDLSDPVHPTFISSYVPTSAAGTKVKPHEMYLWIDPKDSGRALLWLSTPSASVNSARPNLMIVDITDVPSGGSVRKVAEGNWNQFFPGAADPATYDFDLSLHSMTPSANGARTYLAYLRGGFGILDTSRVANDEVPAGTVDNLNDDLLTPTPFPTWGTGPHCVGHTAAGCAESHSAVPLPGRPFALTIDEVYGTLAAPSFGWPWGWARLWNVAQPRRPHILGEYKILQNTTAYTPAPGENEFTSYSSHNPTPTRNLIFDSWHSGGEQAIDVSDPGQPLQAGWYPRRSPRSQTRIRRSPPDRTRSSCGAFPSSATA